MKNFLSCYLLLGLSGDFSLFVIRPELAKLLFLIAAAGFHH
jgi:hypothetical protein